MVPPLNLLKNQIIQMSKDETYTNIYSYVQTKNYMNIFQHQVPRSFQHCLELCSSSKQAISRHIHIPNWQYLIKQSHVLRNKLIMWSHYIWIKIKGRVNVIEFSSFFINQSDFSKFDISCWYWISKVTPLIIYSLALSWYYISHLSKAFS